MANKHTWYELKKVRRASQLLVSKTEKVPWWFLFLYWRYIPAYQEGIVQINEKGETRTIWEKL